MLTDTIATRYLSLLYCHLEKTLDITPMPSVDNLVSLYKWGDSLLEKFGNNAYTYIKDLEPIAIAVYLEKWETVEISSRFYKGLLEDAQDDKKHLDAMTDLFSLLLSISDHPNILLELFGAYRHFGHPTIDELKGIDVLR